MRLQKLPVFPNWFPYNDMLLDGHMKVDEHEGVKSRCWEWKYRGPVLLYNSLRTAQPAVKAYDYTNSPQNHKVIVGVGELVDVIPSPTNPFTSEGVSWGWYNHAVNPKTQKVCAEIHEDAWSEVKGMIAGWKLLKKRKSSFV